MTKAEIIADSINPKDCRLTTFVTTFPRAILAELNTHRVFSRNSASSRAIPFAKMLEMVKTNPFIPIRFQKDHKGMQGTEYFEGAEHDKCVEDWLSARDRAVEAATSFRFPVTKQLRNRLLEPYMWHTAIISSTDYENFFALRAHPDAEIHIQDLAQKMLTAYNESNPVSLNPGDWHIPFGDRFDIERIFESQQWKDETKGKVISSKKESDMIINDFKVKIATARSARISYNNFEGKDDYSADINMCKKLFGSAPRHLSPAEHVAECQNDDKFIGNFRGFKQYRYFFNDQNLNDPRVIKKKWIQKN